MGIEALFDLAGKIALVTGGAAGIGAGIAELLARAGATVVIADCNADAATHRVELLKQQGLAVHAQWIDVTDEKSVADGVGAIVAERGAPWILVNNAGVQHRMMLLDTTVAHWDVVHAVNARGTFLMLREVAKHMIEAGQGGRIVNIASLGVRHPMIDGLAAYSSSKGAVMTLTQNAAYELAAHQITVNAVLPGGVATGAVITGPEVRGPGLRRAPLGQCEPSDMAVAVLYLSSPGARYVTNAALSVDAGYMLT
jgi:NAD(P)-dependent dehydrogenase (short-subunit alcohol dehydrogenase family)